MCLNCLLRFKFTSIYINNKFDFNHLNNELEKIGLQSFQHRVLFRLLIFGFKIFNNIDSPKNLSDLLNFNETRTNNYNLRSVVNNAQLSVPPVSYLNNFDENTYGFILPKSFCISDIKLSLCLNNINIYCNKFIYSFF